MPAQKPELEEGDGDGDGEKEEDIGFQLPFNTAPGYKLYSLKYFNLLCQPITRDVTKGMKGDRGCGTVGE